MNHFELEGGELHCEGVPLARIAEEVGTLLGDRKVNIANFALGRNQQAEEAIGLVNVDDRVPAEVLNEIRAIPAVRVARVVEV